jgi:hypothetical protein
MPLDIPMSAGRASDAIITNLQTKVALTIGLAMLVAACAASAATAPGRDAGMPCPEWTSGRLGLTVAVVPIAVPGTIGQPQPIHSRILVSALRLRPQIPNQGPSRQPKLSKQRRAEFRVSPFLGGNRLHAQTQAIDVVIVPGGAAVDQFVVVTSSLWDKDRRPIAPAQLNIELSPPETLFHL